MAEKRHPSVQTLKQARAFVIQSGICGIFSNAKKTMPSLWDVVDLPGRQPGEKGWGQKITSIWIWKNQLPADFPDEIFYGKIKGGLAVLMSLDYLRAYYPDHHLRLKECSALARRVYEVIRFEPFTTRQLCRELDIAGRPERSHLDRALKELQITLNITRRNSREDENDTWVPFTEQYLSVVRAAEKRQKR